MVKLGGSLLQQAAHCEPENKVSTLLVGTCFEIPGKVGGREQAFIELATTSV